MNHFAISVLILSVMSCSGSKPGNETLKKSFSPNEVVLVLRRTDSNIETSKNYPLYDTIRLPLKYVISSTGSVTALNFNFENEDDGTTTTFSLFIPAAPKLKWVADRGVDMTLQDATLPYTLSGDDYHPYPNALSEGDVNANASLRTHSNIADNNSYLGFDINEISIQSINCNKGVVNIEMSLKLSSLPNTDSIYGAFSADVFIYVKDFEADIIMVD